MKRGLLHFIALLALLAAGTAARAQNTNTNTGTKASADSAAPRMNLTTFQIIESRNIFDPNRRPRVIRDSGPRVVVEYFGLSGAMTYDNQAYAFFDGSGQSRNRAFKPAEKINGYTIAAITNNSVKLDAGSNQVITLMPGMQMRRENNGPWKLVPGAVVSSDSGSSGSSADSSGGASMLSGPDADVAARLMKKREAEMKDQSGESTGTAGSTGTTGSNGSTGDSTNEIHQ